MEAGMKAFLIVDDHEIVRSGLKNVLSDLYKPCVIEEAGDEPSAVERLKKRAFDLVIMDVQMPDSDSFGLMEYIDTQYPESKVIIFSMSSETIYAKRFLKAGALGFVSKTAGLGELKKAIDLALNNRRYISDSLAQAFANQLGKKQASNPFDQLSTREFNIAVLLSKGNSINAIANLLNLNTSTVGTYKSRIFEKLQIRNIVELVELSHTYQLI